MAEAAMGLARGLVGGKPDLRVRAPRFRPVEAPFSLSPLTSADEAQALQQFLSRGRVAVEIGFGKGSFLTELARQHPDWQVLGVEVRKKYCYLTASKLARAGVQNARLLLGDARDLLPRFVGPGTIDLLFIMFPDPWWKRRHFKKRILEPRFLADLAPLMRPGAELVVRSDVALVIDLARQAAAESGRFRECPGPAPALPDTDRERACRKREIAVSQIRFALG